MHQNVYTLHGRRSTSRLQIEQVNKQCGSRLDTRMHGYATPYITQQPSPISITKMMIFKLYTSVHSLKVEHIADNESNGQV